MPRRRPPPGEVAASEPLPVGAGMLAAQPADDPVPDIGAQVAEGGLGHPVSEVVGPAPQHRVEPAQQFVERFVATLAAQGLHRGHDLPKRDLGRIGIDEVLGRASLPVTPDAPGEEDEALVDVGDGGLGLRQAQPDGGQDRCCFAPQHLGVGPVAVDDRGTVACVQLNVFGRSNLVGRRKQQRRQPGSHGPRQHSIEHPFVTQGTVRR